VNPFKRTVPLLAACQALVMSGLSLIITTSALVGSALAEDKFLTTLPTATLYIAIMLTTVPAAFIMERTGRRAGFMLSTIFGIAGGIIAAVAIMEKEFWWFVVANALVGIFTGFANYYRFAAADAVGERDKSRAVSYVMLGGVIAAFVGPNVAGFTRESIAGAPFAGSYVSLVALYMLTLLALTFTKLPATPCIADSSVLKCSGRPVKQIAAQPKFLLAIICGTLGYGIMSFVMTAVPLAMRHHSYLFSDTSFVIQWHILGMFAPSFFTGNLIRRFGVFNILFAGGVLGMVCVAINLMGNSVSHFWFAMVFLGVSWNFLFIGATTLLTETYHSEEQFKIQALNDFMVFTMVAVASLSAGAFQYQLGWSAVNVGALPLLGIILVSVVIVMRKSERQGIDPNLEVIQQESEA